MPHKPRLIEFTESQQRKCNRCGENIGFVQSQRTGKWYPVNLNVIAGTHTMAGYPADFHKCKASANPPGEPTGR